MRKAFIIVTLVNALLFIGGVGITLLLSGNGSGAGISATGFGMALGAINLLVGIVIVIVSSWNENAPDPPGIVALKPYGLAMLGCSAAILLCSFTFCTLYLLKGEHPI